MRPGDLVDDRFLIERLAAVGGMGSVFRAIDQRDGSAVAIKTLIVESHERAERFLREAHLLVELSHPGIVAYVAHGRTPGGLLWLAMEWLDGEDLSARLARERFDTAEAVRLVRLAAEILGVAHARGVVHRDVKPSNLFLVDRRTDRLKVLDFGVARLSSADVRSTRTGMVLGTPMYMAPEQARADRALDARVDVFSLGCVLFECLAGRPPFVGQTLLAMLAKILLEEAPRVCELADVADDLDALVARMLSKDPSGRPSDATAVAHALDRLEHSRPVRSTRPAPALGRAEQRLLCVALAGSVGDPGSVAESDPLQSTLDADSDAGAWEALRRIVAEHGGRVDRMMNASALITVGGSGAADQVQRAARCLLAVRARLPRLPLSLATGRGVVSERLPVGEAIDRAAALISRTRRGTGPGSDSPLPIQVDHVTAGLLDVRFDVADDGASLVLCGERELAGATRTLLGRPTPCVGRDRELTMLRAFFDQCVAEPAAGVVLVTAAAGLGKSRLRYEFLSSLAREGLAHEVLFGRGDPIAAGAPFGMLGTAIRRAASVLDGESAEISQRKLVARVSRHVPSSELPRIAAFLGELANVPSVDEDVQLRAARRDAVLMGDQMRRAFEDFLSFTCADVPVVVVLEDLHWGDVPSVTLLDGALQLLADRPLLVLALARPDVHESFPRVWQDRGLQEIRLQELGKKPAERLVREMLGDSIGDQTIQRLVARASGNAFFLEELIRAAHDGNVDRLPDTVVAMAHAVLESLEPEARRVLRAASVFGDLYWRSGVAALLGGTSSALDASLRALQASEIAVRRPTSRFPGDEEYAIRHALVREAAYATFTEEDRALGHRLAGAWLEAHGERDPVLLAEHFERGDEGARAARWWLRAAEQALEGQDLGAALARSDRGLARSSPGEQAASLDLVAAEVHEWRGEHEETVRRSRRAAAAAPAGHRTWVRAAATLAGSLLRLGRLDEARATLAELRPVFEAHASADTDLSVVALARLAVQLRQHDEDRDADAISSSLERVALQDPVVAGWLHRAAAVGALADGDPETYLVRMERAASSFADAGHLREAGMARGATGYAYMEMGEFERAEALMTDALAQAARLQIPKLALAATHNLGFIRARRGALTEAREIEERAIKMAVAQGDRRAEGGSRIYLGTTLLLAGDPEAAEREARLAADVPGVAPAMRAHALALLARVLLALGRVGEATSTARTALETAGSLERAGGSEAVIRLVAAEALHAAGDRDAARGAINEARDRLHERAARIGDAERRAAFLRAIPEHQTTLDLARAWNVSAPGPPATAE